MAHGDGNDLVGFMSRMQAACDLFATKAHGDGNDLVGFMSRIHTACDLFATKEKEKMTTDDKPKGEWVWCEVKYSSTVTKLYNKTLGVEVRFEETPRNDVIRMTVVDPVVGEPVPLYPNTAEQVFVGVVGLRREDASLALEAFRDMVRSHGWLGEEKSLPWRDDDWGHGPEIDNAIRAARTLCDAAEAGLPTVTLREEQIPALAVALAELIEDEPRRSSSPNDTTVVATDPGRYRLVVKEDEDSSVVTTPRGEKRSMVFAYLEHPEEDALGEEYWRASHLWSFRAGPTEGPVRYVSSENRTQRGEPNLREHAAIAIALLWQEICRLRGA